MNVFNSSLLQIFKCAFHVFLRYIFYACLLWESSLCWGYSSPNTLFPGTLIHYPWRMIIYRLQCSIFNVQCSILHARNITWHMWICTFSILILLLVETMSIHQLLLTYYFSYMFSGNAAWFRSLIHIGLLDLERINQSTFCYIVM